MAVERSRWTDERLDALAERVMRQDVLEVRIDGLERSLAEFRAEMREFRAEIGADVREFRTDVTAQMNGLRSELYNTKRWMMTMWLSGMVALLAILVQVLRG
jgi:hypothetical protein